MFDEGKVLNSPVLLTITRCCAFCFKKSRENRNARYCLSCVLITELGARFWLLLWPEALLYFTGEEGKCKYKDL